MIRTTELTALFEKALKENWGYIWGTSGEQWTAAKQKALEKTTDDDRAQGRKYGSKWIGHTVADCSGLFTWAFRRLGGTMYHGSDTMYRKYCVDKGELRKGKRADGAALKPGTAIFVWNGKKYSHVGLFTGGDTVIEAMGTINGVTTTKVTAGKWTHWGELQGVDYNSQFRIQNSELPPVAGNMSSGVIPTGAEGGAEESPSGNSRPTLRRGSKGEAVREMQAMLDRLGYDLGSYGVDGDFGKDTEAAVKRFQSDHGLAADGICGRATWARLNSEFGIQNSDGFASQNGETKYAVTISGLDLTQAKAIAANYPGNSRTERET